MVLNQQKGGGRAIRNLLEHVPRVLLTEDRDSVGCGLGAGLDFSWACQARGLNYNLVISIMVCLFVGRVVVRLSRRCAGFHAPAGVLS